MSRCRSVEKQDLHIKSLKLATMVYNWNFLLFITGLWLTSSTLLLLEFFWFQALLYCCFISFTTGILIGLWLVWADFQVLFFPCFMHGLTQVLFLFYYIYSMCGGNPVILQGWVLNWSNLWFFKFRLFYLFSRNVKPIKLKSCRNFDHKGDNLGNSSIILNYIIWFWYW